MQKIKILNSTHINENYCPVCGIKNVEFIDGKSKINECEHLVYIGSDEGPEYDKQNLYSKIENDENTTELSLSKILNDDYVCFIFSIGAPAGIDGYIIYKFNS